MEKFKNFTIKNNFIFGAVMQNPKRCKALLEYILGIKIRYIKYPDIEKSIDNAIDSKGIRLDVYVEDDENTVYNIEMQISDMESLPKRMRYYQSMIDLSIIKKGEPYEKLKKSYVIFICDFDEFGLDRYVYTFENRCIEVPDLRLADDTVKIILNTKGSVGDISDDLKALLDYIGGKLPKSKFTKELDEDVKEVKKSRKWRLVYMTLLMRDRDNIEKGKKIGRREGEAKGRREGEAKGRREGEAKGRREGEIYTMFKRMHMTVEEISKELGLDVDYVKRVIETI